MTYHTKEIFKDLSLEIDYAKSILKLFIWVATWLATLLFSSNGSFLFGFTCIILVLSIAVEFVPKVKNCATKFGVIFWGIFVLFLFLDFVFSVIFIALENKGFYIILIIIAIIIMLFLLASAVFSLVLVVAQTADRSSQEENQNNADTNDELKLFIDRAKTGYLGNVNQAKDEEEYQEECNND